MFLKTVFNTLHGFIIHQAPKAMTCERNTGSWQLSNLTCHQLGTGPSTAKGQNKGYNQVPLQCCYLQSLWQPLWYVSLWLQVCTRSPLALAETPERTIWASRLIPSLSLATVVIQMFDFFDHDSEKVKLLFCTWSILLDIILGPGNEVENFSDFSSWMTWYTRILDTKSFNNTYYGIQHRFQLNFFSFCNCCSMLISKLSTKRIDEKQKVVRTWYVGQIFKTEKPPNKNLKFRTD